MTKKEIEDMLHRLDLQNEEFDALTQLKDRFRRLERTPVVDDDYPEERHYYESALRAFLSAVKKNRGESYFKGL